MIAFTEDCSLYLCSYIKHQAHDSPSVTEQTRGGKQYTITKMTPPFSQGVPPPILGSFCLPPGERHLSMPEIGKGKELFIKKVIQTYSNDLMSPLKY